MQAERLPEPGHPLAMSCHNCDIANLLEASIPDSDFQDLIEWAFIEGQIDGETMGLANSWLRRAYPEALTSFFRGH